MDRIWLEPDRERGDVFVVRGVIDVEGLEFVERATRTLGFHVVVEVGGNEVPCADHLAALRGDGCGSRIS